MNIPTGIPDIIPTAIPDIIPSGVANIIPTDLPNVMPSGIPNIIPTDLPNMIPTGIPNIVPTDLPKIIPTAIPHVVPTSFFDYGDITLPTSKEYELDVNDEFIITSILMGIGTIGSLLVIIQLFCRNGHNFRGIRWYCLNISICCLVYIFFIVASNQIYPVKGMLHYSMQNEIVNYHKPALQWFNTVYCYTTALLFLETIVRGRTSSNGVPHALWFLACVIFDVVPAAYIVLKSVIWPHTVFDPDPLAIYHLAGLCTCTVSFVFLLIAAVLQLVCRSEKEDSFTRCMFYCVVIYGAITIWWQYPASYDIINGLMKDNMTPQRFVEITTEFHELLDIIVNVREYTMLSCPAIIAIASLIFMPTISVFCCSSDKRDSA